MHLLEKISIYIYICKTQPRAWILRVFQIMFLRTPHTFKTDARSHLIERNIISTFQKKHMVSRFRALESVQRTKHLTSYFSKISDVFRKHASCSLWTQIVPEKARLSPKIIPQIPPWLYSMIIFHDYIPWISMIFPWFFHVYPWFPPCHGPSLAPAAGTFVRSSCPWWCTSWPGDSRAPSAPAPAKELHIMVAYG